MVLVTLKWPVFSNCKNKNLKLSSFIFKVWTLVVNLTLNEPVEADIIGAGKKEFFSYYFHKLAEKGKIISNRIT